MSLRVISGRARGHRLKMVPGDTTRPIMDRVKENLFNIVAMDVPGSRWLDMFAGTGAVGIEALSRGAAGVIFLDLARAAIGTIRDNLRTTGLGEDATVLRVDALDYVERYDGTPLDFIYVAPPQYQKIWRDALLSLDRRAETLLGPAGAVIIQIDPREYEELTLDNLVLYDQRTYGSTMLCFYARQA